MILYYTPGGCSQATHIALIETGASYQLVKVGRDKRTEDGRDFNTINGKGYTPALQLEDGTVLTESLAILAYLAESSGRLLAVEGAERWRTVEALEFMTTEIHGQFRPFFRPESSSAAKQEAARNLARRFGTLDAQLGDRDFLVGEDMTIADAYLFVMLSWAAMMGVPAPERLASYHARLRARPAIAKALVDEGLA